MMNEYIAEVVGTAVLILFGCGVNAGVSLRKSYAHQSGWLVIALGWAFAVAFAIYAVGRISGAHINPAVTIGLAASGDFPVEKVAGYVLAQMIGAILGATLIWLHYFPHWKATEDPGTKLGVFSTGPAIKSNSANLYSEMLGTFSLLFVIQMIGANKLADGLNPILIGGLVGAIGISLGGTTGYAINPARDLGPRIAHFFLPIHGKGPSNWKYAWIPVFGPILGGIQGAMTYHALFSGFTYWFFWLITGINFLVIALIVFQSKD